MCVDGSLFRFRNIEPLDELLAARICMMLLDSLSVQRLPEKAAQVCVKGWAVHYLKIHDRS